MDPLFKIGDEVPVRIKSIGVQYKKGDIIAFNRDGVIVLHQIIDSYMYKGEVYYVTGGMNPDTNPYVDSTTISRDAIIGKADLSEHAFAEIQELAKQGRVPNFEVYGMPSYTINQRYQIDQKDIGNYESNNFYDYLKINLLVDDISKIFGSDSDQFIEQLFQEKEFLKNVFNTEVMKIQYKKDKLPNLLGEIFYSIYIMNPEGSLNSAFNRNNKKKALNTIKEYLLSNSYDPTNLGLDEKELFDNYYDEFMQIIETSLKIEIDGKEIIIAPRSLDLIEGRIWYKIQEFKFEEFINDGFAGKISNDYLKTKLGYHLRNIFKVKSRILIDDSMTTGYLMRTSPTSIWQTMITKYKGDLKAIFEASMRGDKAYDRQIKIALEKNKISPKSNRHYQLWCTILGVDYRELLAFIIKSQK